MTPTLFSCQNIELNLYRYPKKQESNLQAWDAGDEHLIKHLKESQQQPVVTAVINDSFGALQCALTRLDPQWPMVVETDAKTSQLGAQQNLAINELSGEQIQTVNSRAPLADNIELVLMKLPKNLSYFGYQLQRLSQVLPQGTNVFIAAKAKSINQALLQFIQQNLGPASASLTWKKTRVIHCVSDGNTRKMPAPVSWNIDELGLTISNYTNVFAANKLDIGARIMLDNMPQGEYHSIIDLGCGNGVLGLRAAQLYPQAEIHFVDDSEMAVASAEMNFNNNNLTNKAVFHWDDCLTHLTDVKPDLVLCNPPFHQGEAITDHIAWQMFLDAYKALSSGGVLHVVGNRHLAYHVKLKRIFKNCHTVASNGKFVILQAIKQ
ncbi:methyltransferase [Shewanella gaetbuli]|uniref:Ribosomal RNA large subunit methyltransferase G n=1 Tax=Shewanella gaetbuli TaxID=220752 RepID=A0A9X2CK98_9GAMM|nr:methyltransferase [Shewanella gaetbuli]MCL1141395.1 methyltransferase [Shewanella gaetbuli]